MGRSKALSALNGRILAAYSARTIAALRARGPLRLVLKGLEPVLALNVDKEARKDALVIRRAADALAARTAPHQEMVQELVNATKAIDREFVGRVQGFPVHFSIRYDDIAAARSKRIGCLLGAAYRLLAAWEERRQLRTAFHAAFSKMEFERQLQELLLLYAVETRALSGSVRLPSLIAPLRDRAAGSLYVTMNEVASRLAAELAHGVYRSASVALPQERAS